MGKIVTFEQAKRLKELGFDGLSHHAYWNKGNKGYKLVHLHEDYWNRAVGGMIAVPTVSDALDWLREEKGIVCGINIHRGKSWVYNGKYLHRSKLYIRYTPSFDTHPLAELALLDAVLTYLEEKK